MPPLNKTCVANAQLRKRPDLALALASCICDTRPYESSYADVYLLSRIHFDLAGSSVHAWCITYFVLLAVRMYVCLRCHMHGNLFVCHRGPGLFATTILYATDSNHACALSVCLTHGTGEGVRSGRHASSCLPLRSHTCTRLTFDMLRQMLGMRNITYDVTWHLRYLCVRQQASSHVYGAVLHTLVFIRFYSEHLLVCHALNTIIHRPSMPYQVMPGEFYQA